jgi:hypothetical protein
MGGTMLNDYLPGWLDVIFFPFRNLPRSVPRITSFLFTAPFLAAPLLAYPRVHKLAPQWGHFVHGKV